VQAGGDHACDAERRDSLHRRSACVAFGGFNTTVSANIPGGLFDPLGGGAFATPYGPFGGSTSASTTRVGWTAGGGLEYAVTNTWSIRAEYRYTDFGASTIYATNFDAGTLFSGAGAYLQHHFTENRAQVGSSYKFDTAVPAPVVAKY
jgi:outer membrane immunogenic protein